MKCICVLLATLTLTLFVSGCGASRFGEALPGSYDGLTKEEIVERLPSESFVLVDSLSNIPAGWPAKIRKIADVERQDGGQIRGETWQMTLDGDKWRFFYMYALDVYLEQHRMEPAFIYERRAAPAGEAIVPVMSLFFDQAGRARKSSKAWCDAVRGRLTRKKGTSNQSVDGTR